MRTITTTTLAARPVPAFAPSLRQGLCAAAIVLLPYLAMTAILLLNR
ncbi:Uncharacterised protein [Mycobacteroides abscessus subsp. abscessus]|nr:Uncharacterised protein [Mycobacteroides abscessus subsp. abscessus]